MHSTMKTISLALATLLVASAPAAPKTIHVVFKTHLDVGFTDFPDRVVARYLGEYIPRAIETSRTMRSGGDDRYVWTTGSWLISEYIERATPAQRQDVERAIRDGDIVWHAYPFTGVNELMDESLFAFSLGLSRGLDLRYGRRTRAAKLTDVPGETQSVLPLLSRAGVRMLHIGINPACTPPALPTLFLWRHPEGSEVVTMVQPTYGSYVEVPGVPLAIFFAFTGDNKGPHSPDEAARVFAELREAHPGAVVKASTMNAFADEVWPIRRSLPIVTSEIGSTWVHSGGTDPKRYAEFRTLMRLRSAWLASGRLRAGDPRLWHFSRELMMVAEHTGGLDEKEHLDFEHYTVVDLARARETPPYRDMERSWKDARAYLTRALDALENTPFAAEARAGLAETTPTRPVLAGYQPLPLDRPFQTAHFDVTLDPATGAIAGLVDRKGGRQWTDPKAPLGVFWHESFSSTNYKRFLEQYLTTKKDWAMKDFGKPNIGRHGAVSARRLPRVMQSLYRKNAHGSSLLLQLSLPEHEPTPYGLPAEVWLQLDFPNGAKEIRYTVQWFGKRAVRLPEAYWFSLGLAVPQPENWQIEKLGRLISPLDVVSRGGRSLHGFNRGVFHRSQAGSVSIESLDCPIVAPGAPSLLDFSDRLPDLAGGWHFNLFNSKWGTNFPTWYDEDAKFRFVLRFPQPRSPPLKVANGIHSPSK